MNSSRFCMNSDSVMKVLRSGYLTHIFVPCLLEMISRSKSLIGLLFRLMGEYGKSVFREGSIDKLCWLSGKGDDSNSGLGSVSLNDDCGAAGEE